jgi:hypothetical protein
MDNNINDINNNSVSNTALELEIQRMIEELLRPLQGGSLLDLSGRYIENMGDDLQTLFATAGPNRARSSPLNESNDNMVFLQTLRDIMVLYNTNMIDYNANVRSSLQLMNILLSERNRSATREQRPRPAEPNAERTPARNNHLFSYVLYQPTIQRQDADAMRRFFQNIVVRPTQEQIENSTELIQFNRETENVNTSCPITLDDFQDGENVRRIKHCRHTFNEPQLINWFRCNVRCPVCRYDIRDYSIGTGGQPPPTEPSPEELPPVTQENNHSPIQLTFPQENGQPNPFVNLMPNNPVTNLTPNELPGYHQLLQEVTNNFATDINNIITENFRPNQNGYISDTSQNIIFDVHVETNL